MKEIISNYFLLLIRRYILIITRNGRLDAWCLEDYKLSHDWEIIISWFLKANVKIMKDMDS